MCKDNNKKEPYLIQSKEEMEGWPPFPFPNLSDPEEFGGDFVVPEVEGWELERQLFCDSSGLGREHEPSLTVGQLKRELKVGYGYAIIARGPFQVYLGEFTPLATAKSEHEWDENTYMLEQDDPAQQHRRGSDGQDE